MNKVSKNIVILIAFSILAACTPNEKEVPQIEVSTFFKNPDKTAFKLSPSGKYISFLKSFNSRLNIYVMPINSDSAKRITSSESKDIRFYKWIDDENLIYAKDKNGDENYHLVIVSKDGDNEKDITPFEKTRAYFASKLKDEPNTILIAMNKRDKSAFDIYKLNYKTGKYKLIEKNPGNIASWVFDRSGNVRVAIAAEGVNQTVLYKKPNAKKFTPLITTGFREEFRPLEFSHDGKYFYAISNIGRDKTALVKYDPDKNTEAEEIFSHSEVDIRSALFSKKNQELLGVQYITWKRHYKFFNEKWKKLNRFIKRKLPDYDYEIADRTKEENLILIRTYTDKAMGGYYLVDAEKMNLKKIANISPWLNEEQMAKQEVIRYHARDGLLINGYLTLPPNKEPKNLPVVVNVHGGPWHRTTWGFDYVHQFFANRGYAVLDVNYRGSTGYGKKFFEAGFKEWGGKIQDDIADGVNWLLEQGIADPNRIAIYGFSFGGYSALMGLALKPELYACGVDYSGLVDVENLYKTIPAYYKPFLEMMYEMIGDPKEDSEMLRRISPLYLTDKIKKPVLIAQGANDIRVNKSDVDKFVNKLSANGVEVEYIVKEDEGHRFAKEENRIDLFNRIEKFLAAHLKGRKR